MRRLRYQVATSLDGYIAGPNGEFDWIVMDPDIDFAALSAQFDTAVMGRKTFLTTVQQGGTGAMPGMDVVVYSHTLDPNDYPEVSITNSEPTESVRLLKSRPGKDIWLFGGGELFRTLLAAGLVDTVEPAVVPILLGDGVPMLPLHGSRTKLTLNQHHLYPKSGIVLLEYEVSIKRDSSHSNRRVRLVLCNAVVASYPRIGRITRCLATTSESVHPILPLQITLPPLVTAETSRTL
jgi:dihydrofolate reductase